MPNKTKAEIRHAKLSAKAENAATKSFKKDGGIKKNIRLVTKANKLNKRKNLGKTDLAYGMNNEAYALKPLPPVEKNPGIHKLDKAVRNNMGYQMDSSHSFKGNVANNMKTMYMGSVYYQTDPPDDNKTEKVVVGDDGNLKTETTRIDTQDVVEDVFKDNYQGGGKFKNQAEKDWYNDQIKQRTDKGMSSSEAIQDYRNTFKIGEKKQEKVGEKIVQKDVEVKDLADIPRSYESTGNFGRRQQIRGVIQGERKQKRTSIRGARAAADAAGLKGKARREFMRKQKGIAKGKQFENQGNRIAEINRQTALQESQGIIGPGKNITQGFTPGTLKGNYDVRTDSRQGMSRGVSDFKFKSGLNKDDIKISKPKVNLSLTDMKLSPKAMLHFDRKNNK